MGEHVGIGTDYFVVVNCGQTWMKYDDEDKLSVIHKRVVRFLSDKYKARNLSLDISYETGSRSNHPHVNILMEWEGQDAKADDLYTQLSDLLGRRSEI